jgi:hypothetical protein
MTTALPKLDEATRRAWSDYVDALEGLTGQAYADAEQDAWTRLQETLAALEARDAPPRSSRVG